MKAYVDDSEDTTRYPEDRYLTPIQGIGLAIAISCMIYGVIGAIAVLRLHT